MPSPFPGMDPYLEAFDIWPDLHDALAGEIRNELNQSLPSPYYARLEMRPELGIVENRGVRQRIVPDIAVVRHPVLPNASDTAGVAMLSRPRSEVSKSVEFEIQTERIRHHFVEIRDASRGHKLITLIEILSPSNKQRGPDREVYKRKQSEILQSDANLIELDLLRGGHRILPDRNLQGTIFSLEPAPDYLVLVNRAWRRSDDAVAYEAYPVRLREWLPCIPVPLKEGEADVPLDLQFVFNRAYDGGPYLRGAVDYSAVPPEPALSVEDAAWAAQLTRPWREVQQPDT